MYIAQGEEGLMLGSAVVLKGQGALELEHGGDDMLLWSGQHVKRRGRKWPVCCLCNSLRCGGLGTVCYGISHFNSRKGGKDARREIKKAEEEGDGGRDVYGCVWG